MIFCRPSSQRKEELMRSDIKRDLKKVGVGIALIVLFFAGRYVYTVFSISGEAPDTDKLLPKDYTLYIEAQDSDEWPPEIQFDFREKRRIGWGKYGFRKKIVLDRKMIFDIYIPEDYDTDSIYYGIYRDAALDEPVGEVDLGELLKEGDYAELDKPSDYFNLPHHAGAVLEPGTYYLAVYTTEPLCRTDNPRL